MVVQSLALSVIYYCLPIYGSTNNTLLHRVQKLQNFAAKICEGGAKKSAHATPFIEQLQWLKVKDKIILDVAVSVSKVTNNMFPEWFLELPTVSAALHNKCTRQQKKLYVPHTNKDSGDRSLTVRGPRIWNSLTTHITNSPTLPIFAKKKTRILLKKLCQ